MNLFLALDKDFQSAITTLKTEYDTKFFEIEGLTSEQLDPLRFYRKFLGSKTVADVSVDASSNVSGKDIGTMMSESKKSLDKLICFNKMFVECKEKYSLEMATQWLRSQLNGAIYTHDANTLTFLPYCYAFTMEDIARKGLFWLKNMPSGGAKHLSTFNYHILEFISIASNSVSGAVGIPDLLLYMYYFYQNDVKTGYIHKTMTETTKIQSWQELIFNLNQDYLRDGIQTAYTNISVFDRDYFIGMFGEKDFPDGTLMIDHIEEFMEYQKQFLDFTKSLRKRNFFTFPVTTASLIFKDGTYQDEDFAKFMAEYNCEFGDVNIYISETADSLSSCCRLKNDTSLLKGNFNSIGGTSLSIGSIKVITSNLVRVALESDGKENLFFKNLKTNIKLIHEALHVHRTIIQKNIDKGLYPLYDNGLIKIENQYSTVGINGIFEAVKLLGGISENESGFFYNKKGKELAKKIMNEINDQNVAFSKGKDFTINMEQVPFESGSIKNCKKDKLLFGDKITVDTYGNQWVPLDVDTSLFHRLEMSAMLDKEASGGAIGHRNRSNTITPEQNYQDMIAMAKMGIVYYSDIVKMNICEHNHTYVEETETCPICGGKKVDESVKIVGYLTRKSSYQKERKTEMEERKFYSI